MRARRVAEHAAVLALGLSAGLDLDGGLRPWTAPLVVLVVTGAVVLGRFRPLPDQGWSRLWAVAPGVALTVAVAAVDRWEAISALALAALSVALPFALARARRQQIELLAAERSRTAALLAQQDAVADGARLAERSRLAADIHHTLGHELALLGVQAGALEVTCDDPARRDAARAVRASAVAATDHLRRTLDLLEPTTTPSTVEQVVDRAQRTGLDVELARDNGHDTDNSNGEGGVPVALARLIEHTTREGITNAARHAAGAPIRVSYRTGPTETVLAIINAPGRSGEPGTGRGLSRLAEQSQALGAELRFGPEGQGWALRLRAPR